MLQNRAGKTRLAKYYAPYEDAEKHKMEYEVHRLVVGRDPKHTNFVEVRVKLENLTRGVATKPPLSAGWVGMGIGGRDPRDPSSVARSVPPLPPLGLGFRV